MTAGEYAKKVAESDFHFPHPNFRKFIEEAFNAGMEEAAKEVRNINSKAL